MVVEEAVEGVLALQVGEDVEAEEEDYQQQQEEVQDGCELDGG